VNRRWLKSQGCNADQSCVEVSWDAEGVGVRDSKHPDGPMLWFDWEEWRAFIDGVKTGEFDGPARAHRL